MGRLHAEINCLTVHVLVLPSWYPMQYAPTSGIFFQEQAQALHDHGLKVGVIYPNLRRLRTFDFSKDVFRDHFQVSAHLESGIPEYRLHAWNPVNSRLRLWAFRLGCRRLMRKYIQDHGLPDLIHAHCAVWGGVAAQDLAEKFDVPYVITEHSSAFLRDKIDEWQKPYIRDSFEAADAVWAVSNILKESLKSFLVEGGIGVMPNMVDVKFFRPPDQSKDGENFNFLSVGSLKPNKGIDVLLRAFSKIIQSGVDVRLEIAGSGPEGDKLRTLAKSLKVQDRVQFLGRLSRQEVRRAMWRANAFVSSSYVETFGVVLIEAMATGLPVIATKSGGPQDIVDDENGCLVPIGNPKAYSEAMVKIIKKYNSFNKKLIRRKTERRYSRKSICVRLKKEYEKIRKEFV